MITIDEAGCLEAALHHYGAPVHVKNSGLIIESTSHGPDLYLHAEISLDALPLAHRLHFALTGHESGLFKHRFKEAARRCELDREQIEEILKTFDRGPVDPLLVDAANFRAKKHVVKYNRDKEWRVLTEARPERRGPTLYAKDD